MIRRTGRAGPLFLSLILDGHGRARGAAQPVAGEAYVGRPYGVGRITLGLAAQEDAIIAETLRLLVQERDGRVMYPAFVSNGLALRGHPGRHP